MKKQRGSISVLVMITAFVVAFFFAGTDWSR
jgi:preprotein translocase subunit SecE